ncbi:hypothetical protein BDR07DRAFT_1382970 [Suillus spraguei]|nr:hypothetical protein BDR07DRAFT_1382970 [Suillus spraguei]
MATNSNVFVDSGPTPATAPPSYDMAISASPIQCDQPSTSSYDQKCAAVLSRIRDMVLAPNFTPSSVAPNINAGTAALPAAELSSIINQPNIEGHTALYWAIMNNRQRAVWALNELILIKYSPDCKSDLGLNFGTCCPRDKLEVHICDEATNQFNVVLQIGMFQKRLRTVKRVCGPRLSPSSLIDATAPLAGRACHPARLSNAVLLIEAHSWKQADKFLVPQKSPNWDDCQNSLSPNKTRRIGNELGDWVTHNKTKYVDHEGTLHAKLEITFSKVKYHERFVSAFLRRYALWVTESRARLFLVLLTTRKKDAPW